MTRLVAGFQPLDTSFEYIASILVSLSSASVALPNSSSAQFGFYFPETATTVWLLGHGFGNFDVNGFPTTGTITSVVLLDELAQFGSVGFSEYYRASDLSLSAALFRQIVLERNASAFIDALFSGADVFEGLDDDFDTIFGYGGNDFIRGGVGANFVDGGAGDDTVILTGIPGTEFFGGQYLGGTGIDSLRIEIDASEIPPPEGFIRLIDLRNSEISGFERIELGVPFGLRILFGEGQIGGTISPGMRIAGTSGTSNQVFFQIESTGVNRTISLDALQLAVSNWGADDWFSVQLPSTAFESVTLVGSGFRDWLVSGVGNDTLQGLAGDDILEGGGSSDRLVGGTGSDLINGGSGTDVSVFDFSQSQASLVRLASGTVYVGRSNSPDIDTHTSVENFEFTSGTVSAFAIPIFTPLQYIASNADLIGAFAVNTAAATTHYIQVGYFEGRSTTTFQALDYVASHTDLIFAFGINSAAATTHYIRAGFYEGRSADNFDGLRYIASNPDLIRAFGLDETFAATHYVQAGYFEGRSLTAFQPLDYIASHADLIRAFGTNTALSTYHYVQAGFNEGRSADSFDGLRYIASNVDLISAFGADEDRAATHYVQAGFYEGRSLTLFNPAQYLANYGDLQAAFGNDLARATAHYIQAGFYEGRTFEVAAGARGADKPTEFVEGSNDPLAVGNRGTPSPEPIGGILDMLSIFGVGTFDRAGATDEFAHLFTLENFIEPAFTFGRIGDADRSTAGFIDLWATETPEVDNLYQPSSTGWGGQHQIEIAETVFDFEGLLGASQIFDTAWLA